MYAEKSDDYFSFPRREIAKILPHRTNRVLELGCGTGETMRWIRVEHEVEYAVGIEMSPGIAERAASVFDVVQTGDVEAMELPVGKFDLIVALDVLEHLVDPWSVVKRLHAALNPGGCIVASIPNVGHCSVCVPLMLRGRWNYAKGGLLDRTHLRFFTRQTAVDLMTCSGLALDKIDYNYEGPAWAENLPAWARWYSVRILGLVLPRHFFDYQFLIRVKAVGASEDPR
jgi:SAM-dependent methyltransferase